MIKRAHHESHWKKVRRKRGNYYLYNVPVVLDTEASSWLCRGMKCATMYAWAVCFNGLCVLGRNWSEYIGFWDDVQKILNTSTDRRLVVYCHNLAYDFQWIRGHHEIVDMFALDTHEPLKAIDARGIEFRCSYKLSGFSLEKVGKDLTTYKMRKMVGDLDYNKVRHSGTPLTKKEIGYIIHDVKVAACYIMERIESDGGINKIPLTSTGYVRELCRSNCYAKGNYRKYRNLMERLTINDADEYAQLCRAFQGGFTHASEWKTEKTLFDVTSFDFSSSYPAAMVSELYPMSKGQRVEVKSQEDFEYCLKNYCCVFDVEFTNLESATTIDHPISKSRCWGLESPEVDNGRIVSANVLRTTMTDVDFQYIKVFYNWEGLSIANMIVYTRGYLPTPFVKTVLDLYRDKTELKGVAGREADYMHRKGMANSCYGMTVTNIVRDVIEFSDGEWGKHLPNIEEAIEQYNNSSKRFLFYPWGVFVTAYARLNLFTGIYEAGEDYVYSDTDSIKILHAEKHSSYINAYNEYITAKMRAAMEYHKLPEDYTEPKTIKGVAKPLGVWDFDGHYKVFKTLGAKRYLYMDDNNNVIMTVAGLGKSKGRDFLVNKYGRFGCWKHFANGLEVPAEETGKLTHTYIEDKTCGVVTDYLGCDMEWEEQTSIHMAPAPYKLSMADDYLRRLAKIKEVYSIG